ncbi:uncharacterized protein [Ptychodera flava]|uniref:uncharacterized protein n=1 Tax=Ptychodera flava TaxID=63121 RepID=UPI003969E22A
MRLLLLAIAIVGAYAQNDGYEFQECPDNVPEELIAFGAQEGINEMYDKDIQPLYELVLFDLEQGYTPFESHTVGLVANDKEQPFSQFTVTVENIDEKCSPGVLKATNSRTREIKSCPNVIVNSDDLSETHTKVSFRWKAPECGCVLIR